MHELSVAVHILELVEEERARRGGVRVAAIHLKLGPLSGVVKGALLSAYQLAREGTDLSDCEMKVEDVPVTAYCSTCRDAKPVASMQQMCCSVCGTVTPEVLTGRELEIAALEICE